MSAFTVAYLGRLELWGLAASLVQGALVLASWRAWDRTLANASAVARYRLACLHFAALVVLPLAAVAIVHWSVTGIGDAGIPAAESGTGLAAVAHDVPLTLTIVWLIGAGAMTLRLLGDGWHLARLRRSPAPHTLVGTVRRLARDGFVPGVRLADIATPQIVGVWRPALLLPRDLVHTLSRDERDAVLLHELAHVQRGDFGWNLLQRSMLALLWFHPAAWILYGALSREREACCDAWALRHGASPTDLARALIGLADRAARPALAMAAGHGDLTDLTMRIHRLLDLQRREPPPIAPRAAAIVLSLLCVAALCAGRLGSTDPAIGDLYVASAFGPTIAIEARDPAGSFALRIHQGRVVEASIGNRRLPSGHIRQDGERVVLTGGAPESTLALTVTPQGRIRWNARS